MRLHFFLLSGSGHVKLFIQRRRKPLPSKSRQVQKLLIGHFSARYKDPLPLLQEAQAVFPQTLLAEEGKTYPIEHA
jgi:hypothetical protein